MNKELMDALKLKHHHIENLMMLANYLQQLPDDYEHFSMIDYVLVDDDVEDMLPDTVLPEDVISLNVVQHCGTTACALGHGPYAGVSAAGHQGWLNYAEDNFIGDSQYSEAIFDQLFGEQWAQVDDTAQGAAARIAYFLEYGLSDYFAWYHVHDGTMGEHMEKAYRVLGEQA